MYDKPRARTHYGREVACLDGEEGDGDADLGGDGTLFTLLGGWVMEIVGVRERRGRWYRRGCTEC